MSEETTKTEADDAGEQGEPSRIAGAVVVLVLTGLAILALKAIITAFPYVAYYVAGLLTSWGWQRARTWLNRRGDDVQEPGDEHGPDALDAVIALHALSRGNSVLLTALRDELELPDTKTVKALLDEADVPYKAVRTPTGNGPGVHKDDIPPMVSPADDSHDERCCCRSDDNDNADNATGDAPQKGTRVEAIGDGGRLVSELAHDACRNRPAPDPDDA
ncbi:hypothetical protein PV569_13045 [Streptomyces scabiei]|uniref:hypothetical protein n=1 Tax=Streptomyces scabiei TaxID=1930 RepID=UPI0029BBDFD9|nr:hypothetical protein [Streptomyces scabiei]MDX3294633.1 hypothetical protein [Streptomyces scabiei]